MLGRGRRDCVYMFSNDHHNKKICGENIFNKTSQGPFYSGKCVQMCRYGTNVSMIKRFEQATRRTPNNIFNVYPNISS